MRGKKREIVYAESIMESIHKKLLPVVSSGSQK